MSPPGRPKGEFRSVKHEGSPVSPQALPRANSRVAGWAVGRREHL